MGDVISNIFDHQSYVFYFYIHVTGDSFFQLKQLCESLLLFHYYAGLVGLQAAVMEPQTCKGIVLLDISLRMLHISKQPWYGKPFIRSFQNLLR
jgi:hypothetical protein